MNKKIISALMAFSLLTISACSTTESSHKVKSLQRKDKKLSCKEILLEMNEAEFYKKMANKNKGPKLKSVLMPLGYISTYMDAEEAIEAADARVSYLDQIYEIMRCEEREDLEVPVYAPPYSMVPGIGVPRVSYSPMMPVKALPVYPY